MSETQNEIKIQITPTLTTHLVAVQKRSGETVPFDAKKIYDAIKKAVAVTTEISDVEVVQVTQEVLKRLDTKFADKTPSVENIQEIVIQTLMDSRAYKTAEAY
ncbi:MAG: ATP cone domain-containing protein, partial [Alphaproteobacteria bacterium]|nr:ATP cone domain-containing protein [Alphaproteobacteria bacterium]